MEENEVEFSLISAVAVHVSSGSDQHSLQGTEIGFIRISYMDPNWKEV